MSDPAPLRMLYIDDDAGLGRLVERSLARHAIKVTHVTSGEAGLEKLRGDTFDAIGLDHYMPGRDGLDILPDIMAMANPPPVIYVTGADEGRIAIAALKAGAVDYVVKDVSGVFLDLLRSAVNQALESVRLRRQKEQAERDMREARDRAEMLLREVNHRVANSLQLVASLVAMQQRASEQDGPVRDALLETRSRINAISQIHRRLYTSDDVRFVEMDVYLQGLVDELEAAMKATGRDHAITFHADPVRVGTDKAVSVGVIVTELVTNAYKYAYPAGHTGQIRVSLTEQDGTASLEVADDGVGHNGSAQPTGSGLGMRIIRAMTSSLGTDLVFDDGHRGTRAHVAFAIDAPAPAA